MSNLNCPLCQSPMQETTRHGVTIDSCPRCRGVWLDRGELEKLAAALAGDMAPMPQQMPPQQMHAQPYPPQMPHGGHYAPHPGQMPPGGYYKRYDDDDDDYKKYGYGKPYRKKTAMHALLDFFD